MTFSQLGLLGTGFGLSLGPNGPDTSWVLPGASVDIDLANNRAWVNGTGIVPISSLLSCSRASQETYTDASGNLSYIVNNTLAMGSAGLQVWEGRTNLFTQSQTFSTWTAVDTVIAANSITSPDGTTNGASLTQGSSGTSILTSPGVTIGSGSTFALSGFVKVGSSQWLLIEARDGGASNTFQIWIDLVNKLIGSSSAFGTGSVTSSSSVNVGNGWQYVTMVGTLGAGITQAFTNVKVVAGNGSLSPLSNAVYNFWGAQMESAGFASPYIPTTAASASRASDNVTATGALLTALKAAAASVIAQAGPTPNFAAFPRIIGSAPSNQALPGVGNSSTGTLIFNGTTALVGVGGNVSLAAVKVGTSWSASGRALVGNNGTVVTDVNVQLSEVGAYTIGSGAGVTFDGNIQRLTTFNSQIPNATLKSLTQ